MSSTIVYISEFRYRDNTRYNVYLILDTIYSELLIKCLPSCGYNVIIIIDTINIFIIVYTYDVFIIQCEV